MNEVLHHPLNPALIAALLGALVTLLLVRGVFLGYPRPVLPRGSMLSAKEQAIIAAVADALFPAGGPIPVSGTEAGLVAYMEAHMARVPPGIRLLLRLLTAFIEHGPWLFGPKPARFTRLRPGERVKALEDMLKSSIYFRRVVFLSIRTILSMGYLANPKVVAQIGCFAHISPFEVANANASASADVNVHGPAPVAAVASLAAAQASAELRTEVMA